MLVEFGNHTSKLPGLDDRPKVTRIEIPDFDTGENHPEGIPTGGYTHTPGELSATQLKDHLFDARSYAGAERYPVTQLPGHEALLAIESSWPLHAAGPPAWVKASPHPELTPDGHAADIEAFLSEFYACPTLEGHYGTEPEEAVVRKELDYWTPNGPPGENRGVILPELNALYTDDGRAMNNNNDGGDSLTAIGVMQGVGTGSTATTLTGCSGLTTNGLAGHRVYVYTTSGNVFVWGNCISNTATAITVDQWYVPATPGGSAGASPGTPWAFVVVDGGMVSDWFAALATGANAPVHGDHTLSTNGNVEYTQAGGTLIRKICPTGTTSGVATRTVTLVPVFTAGASDVANLPKVFTTIGFFTSMVVSFGGAGGPMKFETALNASATVAAQNDQVTVTEVKTGS